MRAALGLALVAGSAVLALLVLRGRTPFDASTSGAASGGTADAAVRGGATSPIQNPTAAQQIQHFGGF